MVFASLLAILAEPVYTALIAVAVASYFLFVRRAPPPLLPGTLQPQGTTQLSGHDFGRESEHLRDVGRAYAAGAIYLWDTAEGHPPRRLQPAVGTASGVETKASEEHMAALLSAVAAARGGEALSAGAWARLASMLTVNPALAVLTQAGMPPSILQHRFVIGTRPGAPVRVYTLGFVGTPQGGPRPDEKYAAHLLTIASADLLAGAAEAGAGADALRCVVSHEVRPAAGLTRAETAMCSPFLVWS